MGLERVMKTSKTVRKPQIWCDSLHNLSNSGVFLFVRRKNIHGGRELKTASTLVVDAVGAIASMNKVSTFFILSCSAMRLIPRLASVTERILDLHGPFYLGEKISGQICLKRLSLSISKPSSLAITRVDFRRRRFIR